jgi:hypothetical protein
MSAVRRALVDYEQLSGVSFADRIDVKRLRNSVT